MNASLSELFGRLHPVLVHFPIALLLLAAATEVWRLARNSPAASAVEWSAVILGTVAALASAGTGWVLALEHHRSDTAVLLERHRWFGLATAILALVAAGTVWRWNESTEPRRIWLRRGAVWATALVLIVAAHFGAMLVWGEDFFAE